MHKFDPGKRIFFRLSVFVLFTAIISLTAAMAQTGGLKGKVRGPNGKAIANANITARLDGKDVKNARSNGNGEFAMSGLREGVYNIVFEAPGYASGVLYGVEVKKGTRDLGGRLILSIDRGTLVFVRGSVFYKEGTSLPGAKVELALVNSDGSTRRLAAAVTNISGEFSFRRPEGPARLRITARFKGVSDSKEIDVDTAAIYRTAITLDILRTEK